MAKPGDNGKSKQGVVVPARGSATAGLNLRRPRPDRDELPPREPPSVSAGPVDRVIELAYNPTREKIREMTVIDRMQGRLFPLIDTINTLFHDCIEVSTFRQSEKLYRELYQKEKPDQVDIMDDFLFRTAQWQKSVAGKNLEKATDIALAEVETRAENEEDPIAGGRGYED